MCFDSDEKTSVHGRTLSTTVYRRHTHGRDSVDKNLSRQYGREEGGGGEVRGGGEEGGGNSDDQTYLHINVFCGLNMSAVLD